MKGIIGIDLGTSGVKVILTDTYGKELSCAVEEYPLIQPQNGMAEQDANIWWEKTAKCIKKTVSAFSDLEVAAIGLTGQMHGLVMLGSDGEVLRNVIIWCDVRSEKECKIAENTAGAERLRAITASPALPGFTLSKILWVKNNEPYIFEKCRHILLPKDYIRYKLTGEFASDVSDASGMQLIDIEKRCFSRELLSLFEIDESLLPKLYESCDVSGFTKNNIESETGLKGNIPVAAGAGDNAASAVGMGTLRSGEAFTTIGTSGVVFAHLSKPAKDALGRVHTFCAAAPGEWHCMGVTQSAGLSLKFFKDNFMKNYSYKEIDKLCKDTPIGSDRLLFLPYLMGERTPHLNAFARGVFFGISASHTAANFARAIMEGVSFSLKNCLDIVSNLTTIKEMKLCGGGAESPFWGQMLADIFNMEVTTLKQSGGAASGAAILGGVCAGIYKSVYDAPKESFDLGTTFNPNPENHCEYMKFYEIYNTLYNHLKDDFDKLCRA